MKCCFHLKRTGKQFILLPFLLSAVLSPYTVGHAQPYNQTENGDQDLQSNIRVQIVEPISPIPITSDSEEIQTFQDNTIQISVARGEYEPASIVLTANMDITSLDITATDLIVGSKTFKKENISIKIVKEWFQADEAWYGRYAKNKERVLVPELLLHNDNLVKVDYTKRRNFLQVLKNDQLQYVDISENGYSQGSLIHKLESLYVKDSDSLLPFDLLKAKKKQIWITVHSPTDQQPGKYHGEILLKHDNSLVKTIPIQIEVYPFTLSAPNIEYSIYYRAKLTPRGATISSEFKDEKQLKTELQNLMEHGISNPNVYQSDADLTLLDKYFTLRSEVGMSNNTIYYYGIRTGVGVQSYSLLEIQQRLNRISPILEKHTIKNLYIYGIDEAKGETLALQTPLWADLRSTGIKIFVAGYKGSYDLAGNELDLLVLAGKPVEYEINKFHEIGHKVFSYNNPQVGAENPFLYRKNYGLNIWRSKLDGVMNYAYQTSFQSVWNDFDHLWFRDHNFTYPVVDGVIDTIAWEGFREGVDDIRYLSTLLEKIGLHENDDTPTIAQKVQQAKEYLQNLQVSPNFQLNIIREKLKDLILSFGFNDSHAPRSPQGLTAQ